MATPGEGKENERQILRLETQKLLSSYLGVSFSVFLAYIPGYSLSLLPQLQTQVSELTAKLLTAEEQLRQMKSRRKEDSKANAKVVEIFASHRNAWQLEEKHLLQLIEDQRTKMEELEREMHESSRRIEELQDMIGFISTSRDAEDMEEESAAEETTTREDQVNFTSCVVNNGGYDGNFPFTSEFLASDSSNFWAETERATLWQQDVQYESLESLYHMNHFVTRRESPRKVDGESTGLSSKLELLEQKLLNLENSVQSDLSRVPSLMRKQARRYQALTARVDDLCRRMQATDPSETTLSLEFRKQRQTEFLLEAVQLQQRASETGQKLVALQTEIGKSCYRDNLGSPGKLATKQSVDSIRNNLQEIQRNLEIWLARIIGDLEGILARDGSSRVREYCISRYPFAQ